MRGRGKNPISGLHGVKYLKGAHHSLKFLVNSDHKKMARDGPTSLFILDVANQLFVVRAIQVNDFVHIWVAFHGHPDHGKLHKAEIQFNFQYGDVNHDLQNYNLTPTQSNRPGPSSAANNNDDEDSPSFCGPVVATTRTTWREVVDTMDHFSIRTSFVEEFLKKETPLGRHFTTECWAIAVTITRIPPELS